MHYALPESKYNEAIIIEEYNGQWSLVLGRLGKDGEEYKKWCYPERDKKPLEKSVPWKIPIGGSKEEARETLKELWQALGGETDDEQIPF